jgi:hypothetical protein
MCGGHWHQLHLCFLRGIILSGCTESLYHVTQKVSIGKFLLPKPVGVHSSFPLKNSPETNLFSTKILSLLLY